MPRKDKEYTLGYGREADWQGGLDEGMREMFLQYLEGQRHELVQQVRTQKADGFMPYTMGKQLLEDLPGGDTLPSTEAFNTMLPEMQGRCLQKMFTDLSDRLTLVEPEGGGGGGGGEGKGKGKGKGKGGKGQGDPSPGNGKPSKGKPQEGQGQQPQPQPQKPQQRKGDKGDKGDKPQPVTPREPTRHQEAQEGKLPAEQKPEGQGQGQGNTPAPTPVTPQLGGAGKESDKKSQNGTPASASGSGQPTGPVVAPPPEDVAGEGGWSTGKDALPDLDMSDPYADTVHSHGGGGEQILVNTKDAPMFYAMRDMWQRLAVDVDFAHKLPDGSERWNVPRVFRAHYNVNLLRNAKEDYDTHVEDVYFSLDTSGSVSSMATVIAGMAAGSVGIVHLFHGTEGRPEYKIQTQEALKYPGQPFPEWDRRNTQQLRADPRFKEFHRRFIEKWSAVYPSVGTSGWGYRGTCFEIDLAWMLELERPTPGSLLAFWGDTQGVGFYNMDLLKTLLRPYRFVWLYCYTWKQIKQNWYPDGDNPEKVLAELRHPTSRHSNFEMAEVVKLAAHGLPVVMGVRDAQSLREAMRQLETLKKGVY